MPALAPATAARDAARAGVGGDALDGGLADAARGHVDDALEGEVGGGVDEEAQVLGDVLHLAPLEEGDAADDAVGEPPRPHQLLDDPRLSMGAVQDGEVA